MSKKRRRLTIYIGCALTLAPKNFVKDIARFKKKIAPYAEVFDFLGLSHPSVGEVFHYDTNCVRRCDLFIANVSYPSIGLGVEFGVAVENKKPIITLVEEKATVSRFVFGYQDPYHYTYTYKTINDAATYTIRKIKELFPQG